MTTGLVLFVGGILVATLLLAAMFFHGARILGKGIGDAFGGAVLDITVPPSMRRRAVLIPVGSSAMGVAVRSTLDLAPVPGMRATLIPPVRPVSLAERIRRSSLRLVPAKKQIVFVGGEVATYPVRGRYRHGRVALVEDIFLRGGVPMARLRVGLSTFSKRVSGLRLVSVPKQPEISFWEATA